MILIIKLLLTKHQIKINNDNELFIITSISLQNTTFIISTIVIILTTFVSIVIEKEYKRFLNVFF